MFGIWQLQEAKKKLSKVVDEAIRHGPQIITRHGVEVAIVLSYDEYRRLAAPSKKLSAFLRDTPLAGADIDLSRDKSFWRDDRNLLPMAPKFPRPKTAHFVMQIRSIISASPMITAGAGK